MDEILIFLSWSGPKSKEVAIVLKTFLSCVFNLQGKQIFISDKDLSGTNGWYDSVCESVSRSSVIIPCITEENKKSPWLHFETGLGSFQDARLLRKSIIPLLYDLSARDLPKELMMFLYHNMVILHDLNNIEEQYRIGLKRLIYQIDSYFVRYESKLREIYYSVPRGIGYKDNDDERIETLYKQIIDKAIVRLLVIQKKYSNHDYFISRPIKGISHTYSEELENILLHIKECVSSKIYFAGKDADYGDSISAYRIGIIKQCQTFVLIYSNISVNVNVPSSSLIELGAALAFSKRVIIFVERNSIVPVFFNDLKKQIYLYREFRDLEELKSLLLEYIDDRVR